MIIKKLNTMFHKHSRWIFGIFAAVIIIAFLDFLTPGSGGCAFDRGPESQSVGTAFGKNVTYGDLIALENDLQVFESLVGGRSQRTPQVLFYCYCVLKRAEQLNFTIADKEIAKLVRILPVFVENGKFSQKKYDDLLKEKNISSAELVESIRKAFIIEQLPMALANNVTVTDQEVENLYKSNFPRVGIRAFKVKAADFAKLVKIDDAALKNFMAANKANYVIPGKFDALAVELASDPYKAAAEKVITDDFTAKFIKDNNYTGADVKTIRPLLVEQKANELASIKMNSFYREVLNAMDAAKDSKEKKDIFRNIAAKNKFIVIEGKDVTFNAAGIDKIVSADLINELRSMPLADSITPVTRPRKSAKGTAVAFLIKRSAPRPMTFDEAKKQLTADYTKAESLKLAAIKAKELWSGIMKLAPAKRSAAFGKLGKTETITYSMISVPEKNPEHMAIVAAAANSLRTMKSGDISGVINTEDGALLVEMVKRMPAFMDDFDKHREMLKQQITQGKMQQLQMEFMTYIDRNCRCNIEDNSQRN